MLFWLRRKPTRCHQCGMVAESGCAFCTQCGSPLDGAGAGTDIKPVTTEQQEMLMFKCPDCGAGIQYTQCLRSYICPFCDATFVAEPSARARREPPKFILPFVLDKPEAQQLFRRWVGGGFWQPRGLARRVRLAEMQGVYVPFWAFSCETYSRFSASIGENWTEVYTETETYTDAEGRTRTRTVTKTRTHTEWYPLNGTYHSLYHYQLVSASRGLPEDWSNRVEPFDLERLKSYAPDYIAGWTAEEYSIDQHEAWHTARQEIQEQEDRAIASFLPGDTHRNLRVESDFYDIVSDLVYLPVWIASYKYRDTLFRFLVNGQTGEVVGRMPVSWWKVLGVVLLGLMVVGLIVFLVTWSQQ